jgi:dTDP-glucose pyrophosphorylase
MQAVFVCGGSGTRLMPRHVGPKSLVQVGGSPLLAGLVREIGSLHTSALDPIVIVDRQDRETPAVLPALVPRARMVTQPRPDGVANALLLALPYLDDLALVALGDLFLAGTFADIPRSPSAMFWRDAPAAETEKNFGIAMRPDGFISNVIEKPTDSRGLHCGMGVYVLTRRAIECFRDVPADPRTGERGITAGIQAAIDAGIGFRAVPFAGYYNNVNAHSDVAAVEAFRSSRVQ